MFATIVPVLNFEIRSFVFVCARPGATWLVHTIILFRHGGGGNKYFKRYFGLGQVLVFGAWDLVLQTLLLNPEP